MALGIIGPIGDLTAFAVAHTFTVDFPTNRNKATCKGCGRTLTSGEGHQTRIKAGNPRHMHYYFLCPGCVQVVASAVEITERLMTTGTEAEEQAQEERATERGLAHGREQSTKAT